ncbi:choline/ethanolamine kinase family protein [Aeromonas finlandensis]|uniref:choline/ethanolamine kinase family protein n=1 Tax=Aeromonas finlandensis TaxID=1543375 RepID=UPI00067D4C97|nr:choline/ethanolamine kinase family protein [Aeromonas finlandensis]
MAGNELPLTGGCDALLASLPAPWREGQLEALGTGLTNSNYRLRLPSGRSYFLRQGHPDPVRLGIDRPTEWQLYQGAMAEGLALPCHYGDPASGLMLLEWCDEPNWLEAAPPVADQPRLLAAVLRKLHRLPLPTVVMAVRAHAAGYRARLAHIPSWLPALERGLLASGEPNDCWRPCHHDLNPANLLGSKPWVIDWEYGAAGHPGFELASIQRTHKWPAERRDALEAHYLRSLPRHQWPDFQSDAFLPWVDYIGLLWALLMAEQQATPDYHELIAINRQRLE